MAHKNWPLWRFWADAAFLRLWGCLGEDERGGGFEGFAFEVLFVEDGVGGLLSAADEGAAGVLVLS